MSHTIQEDIDEVAVWFTPNGLTVNASKSEIMNFGLGSQQYITLMSQKLPQKALCKCLGVYVDGKMTFRHDINYVLKKLNRSSGLVYKVKHLYPSKCSLLLYISYAESVIRYGIQVHGSAAKTNVEKNLKTQRRIW